MTHDGLTTGDWAQVASAAFTALTALAALASVYRVEKDRWRSTLPELHIEVLADLSHDEMRVTVMNHGGPAREVRAMGGIGQFGFFGLIPPMSYWKSGESRTISLAMPLVTVDEVQAFVEGRDMGKRQLVIGTVGGATYRWPPRKAKELSAEKEWDRLFPDAPGPLDVPNTPINMTIVDRTF